MKNIIIRAAIGLSIMGSCLAVATPASAASRLRNAYTSQGTFYRFRRQKWGLGPIILAVTYSGMSTKAWLWE